MTLWTVALQTPLSLGFSRQEYWRGLPCPPPGDLPDPGMEPKSVTSPALAGRFFTTSATWETLQKSFSLFNIKWHLLILQGPGLRFTPPAISENMLQDQTQTWSLCRNCPCRNLHFLTFCAILTPLTWEERESPAFLSSYPKLLISTFTGQLCPARADLLPANPSWALTFIQHL